MFRILRYGKRKRRYVAAAIMGGTATMTMLTNNTFEAEEVDLSIPEIERLLSSIRRRRQVENVMASVSAAGMIAARSASAPSPLRALGVLRSTSYALCTCIVAL